MLATELTYQNATATRRVCDLAFASTLLTGCIVELNAGSGTGSVI